MSIDWHPLEALEDIERIKKRSFDLPCLIYKHSTTCHICHIAKFRLEDDWEWAADEMEVYYLDVVLSRPVSRQVAETFQVHHESPQVLLIVNGECVYDASHLDITVAELRESLGVAKT